MNINISASKASPPSITNADYQCDAVNDGDIINRAIANMGGCGGKIRLSEGAFWLREPIVLPSRVTLEGAGRGSTNLLIEQNAAIVGITASDERDITLRDFSLSGYFTGPGNDSHTGILFDTVYGASIANVEVADCSGNGIQLKPNCGYCTLTEVVATGNGGRGIWLVAAYRSRVVNCTTEWNGLDGIDIDGHSQDIVVTGNVSRLNARAGIFVEENFRDITVSNNICSANLGNGININEQGADQTSEGANVTGNICRGNALNGIRVRANVPGATMKDVVVMGNVVLGNKRNDLVLGAARDTTFTGITALNNRVDTGNSDD